MPYKIKKIILGFENCDSVSIPGHYIGSLFIDDITTKIQSIDIGVMIEKKISSNIFIEIHSKANNWSIFGKDIVSEEEVKATQEKGNDFAYQIFNRIYEYNDITSIDIVILNDNNKEDIIYSVYPYWVGDDNYRNPAQNSYISEKGNLYISIVKDNVDNPDFIKEELIDHRHFGIFYLKDIN